MTLVKSGLIGEVVIGDIAAHLTLTTSKPTRLSHDLLVNQGRSQKRTLTIYGQSSCPTRLSSAM